MSDVRVPMGAVEAQGPGEDPLRHYTRLFVRFLQYCFSTFEKGSYRWELDESLTDVVISANQRVAREAVEKTPAILVMRGGFGKSNLSLDQFKGFDPTTGRRSHTDLEGGAVTFNCIAAEPDEAGRLAWLAYRSTEALKRTLMKAGLHQVGENMQISPESSPGSLVQPEAGQPLSMVTVSVPFYFQRFWSVEPVDKKLLTNIELAVRSQLNMPAPGASPVREPGGYGKVLTYDRVISFDQRVRVTADGHPKPKK